MIFARKGRAGFRGKPKPISARELALQTLVATESRSAYSDRLLERRLHGAALKPEDARLATTLVQGTLRRRGTLDHHLEFLTRGGLEGLPAWIRGAMRLGAYQLLFLDRVPPSASVDESVKLAKKYGHAGTAGLTNAVLRRLARGDRAPLPDADGDRAGHLAVLHSHPRWLVTRWLDRWGPEEAARLLAADNLEPEVSVRVNRALATPEEARRRLAAEGFTPEPGPNGGAIWILRGGFVASRSPSFREGWISLQDEAEAAVVPALDPSPGERALDLCAAPGGKASQIAEAVGETGRLIALERHVSRARALRANLRDRLHHANAHVVAGDGTVPPFRAPFDRVLVDAPCSGLGVLRRRADARWRKEESTIATMAALQAALLEGGAALVRRGGVLVYSVCSLEPEETREIAESFARAHADFAPEDVNPYVPAGFRSEGPYLTATPHRHGTDGVFAARFRRR